MHIRYPRFAPIAILALLAVSVLPYARAQAALTTTGGSLTNSLILKDTVTGAQAQMFPTTQWLAQHAPRSRPQLTAEEQQEAWERLLQHADAAHLGYATGADNEQIDADLAYEYGGTHEEA